MLYNIVSSVLEQLSPDEFKAYCERQAHEADVDGDTTMAETYRQMAVEAYAIQLHPEQPKGEDKPC